MGKNTTPKEYDLMDQFKFGKYIGLTLAKVLSRDPGYLEWCHKNVRNFCLSVEARTAVEAEISRRTALNAKKKKKPKKQFFLMDESYWDAHNNHGIDDGGYF